MLFFYGKKGSVFSNTIGFFPHKLPEDKYFLLHKGMEMQEFIFFLIKSGFSLIEPSAFPEEEDRKQIEKLLLSVIRD